ncbi:MAG: heme biosynthesis HemY N-terminal domain-containing protein [bacterium]
MKSLLIIWLFLLLGAAVAVLIKVDSGYVLLSYDVWTVEMSLALLAFLLVTGFILLYFAVRLVIRTWMIPRQVRHWNQRRGTRLAQRSLTRGLLEMSEGNWAVGEKYLTKHAEKSDTPLLNYLAAARAAQLQGEHERRDAYIRLAHEHMPSADVAVSLTQAELQLADRQMEQALATLKHLRSVAPKHTYVLKLLSRLYEQLGDWEQLLNLLPELRKRKVASKPEIAVLEKRVHRALLEQASISVEPTRLKTIWNGIPRALRHDHELIADYASYLKERNKDELAEPLIRDVLKKEWNEDLVSLYGKLETQSVSDQLPLMEKLLETQPQNPTLLLTLGRLSLRAKLWGKARGYLEAAIGADGGADAYRELGHLLEQMGQTDSAMDVYRRGMLGSGELAPIPLPDKIGNAPAQRPQLGEPEIEAPPPHGARPATE